MENPCLSSSFICKFCQTECLCVRQFYSQSHRPVRDRVNQTCTWKFLHLVWIYLKVNEAKARSHNHNNSVLRHKQMYFLSTYPAAFISMDNYCISWLSNTFFTWIQKLKVHSREALDLLGTLLIHQVLELLVLQGIPERKTSNEKEMKKLDDRKQKDPLIHVRVMWLTKQCRE